MRNLGYGLLVLWLIGCGTDLPASEDAQTTTVGAGGAASTGTTSSGLGGDAGSGGAGGADADPGVPVLMVAGGLGRTMMSCDGGHSWRHHRSDDDQAHCDYQTVDCAHGALVTRGLTFHRGRAYTVSGWTHVNSLPGAGELRVTGDGVSFSVVRDGLGSGGLASSETALLLGPASGSPDGERSVDEGATWSGPIAMLFNSWNVRRMAYVRPAGIFVSSGDGGPFEPNNGFAMSVDDGATFSRPASYPEACGRQLRIEGGFGGLPGLLLVAGDDGTVCSTTDDGATWNVVDLGHTGLSHVVSRDGAIEVWTRGARHRTTDGMAFEMTALDDPQLALGPVDYDPVHGTYAAVNRGYNASYDQQRFYVSSDGVAWTELAEADAVRSHPITQLRFGYLMAGACD